jgi:putative flippase GtrA
MKDTLNQMVGGRAEWQQRLKFLFVGLSNTAVSFAVYTLMLGVLAAGTYRAGLAQLASYSAGMIWSFILNRKWVFKSGRKDHKTALRFAVAQLALMVISAVLITGLVRSFNAYPSIIWIVVMSLITVFNYFLLRHWVFKIP